MSIYSFSANLLDGRSVSFDTFSGKVMLIVNTASFCGHTNQYAGLEALFNKYCDKGFIVLAFPCNQFGQQEPGSSKEIANFCETNFNVTFPIFEKVNVKGDDAHPLFVHLCNASSEKFAAEKIKWNFTKFLIGRIGNVSSRYAPDINPIDLECDIEQLLRA